MLNLLSRALAGMVLDRDARDAMREAGGLASTIQGSADMRAVIQHLAAQQQQRPAIGATPLTSPMTWIVSTVLIAAVLFAGYRFGDRGNRTPRRSGHDVLPPHDGHAGVAMVGSTDLGGHCGGGHGFGGGDCGGGGP